MGRARTIAVVGTVGVQPARLPGQIDAGLGEFDVSAAQPSDQGPIGPPASAPAAAFSSQLRPARRFSTVSTFKRFIHLPRSAAAATRREPPLRRSG